MKHHANALTRKLGPLPVWAWAAITGGVLYVYRNSSSGHGLASSLLGSTSTGNRTGTSTGPLGPGDNSGAKPPKHRKPPKHHKPPKHKPPKNHKPPKKGMSKAEWRAYIEERTRGM